MGLTFTDFTKGEEDSEMYSREIERRGTKENVSHPVDFLV